MFPLRRLRRYRKNRNILDLFSEITLDRKKLVQPIFIRDNAVKREIDEMPGVYRFTVDESLKYIDNLLNIGISNVLLFGVPELKREAKASELLNKAIFRIKNEFSDNITVITDVCLCGYTPHGHCGIIKDGKIDNDETIRILGEMSADFASAGADIVAPSAMMDGQVKAIRTVLDKKGYDDVLIMSYSSKISSSLYGPFRFAANSAPKFGDRSSYQLDFRTKRQAILESLIDEQEGADILMIKPGLFYLDLIGQLRQKTLLPIAVYSVSGEYSMIKLAVKHDLFNEKMIVTELLISYFRSGADIIITYFAEEVSKWNIL